jgi:hypothetical protein
MSDTYDSNYGMPFASSAIPIPQRKPMSIGRNTISSFKVVLDNLNTHSPAAFYEAFSLQQARYLTKKLEFHYTPEHSSWLNMAMANVPPTARVTGGWAGTL